MKHYIHVEFTALFWLNEPPKRVIGPHTLETHSLEEWIDDVLGIIPGTFLPNSFEKPVYGLTAVVEQPRDETGFKHHYHTEITVEGDDGNFVRHIGAPRMPKDLNDLTDFALRDPPLYGYTFVLDQPTDNAV